METTYDVTDAVSRVDAPNDKLKSLDVAVTYNYTVWMTHYLGHLQFLETLNAVGDPTDLSQGEALKYCDGLDVLHQQEMEIGNISPECYNENGICTRIIT